MQDLVGQLKVGITNGTNTTGISLNTSSSSVDDGGGDATQPPGAAAAAGDGDSSWDPTLPSDDAGKEGASE